LVDAQSANFRGRNQRLGGTPFVQADKRLGLREVAIDTLRENRAVHG
jgi:hypothetical protein